MTNLIKNKERRKEKQEVRVVFREFAEDELKDLIEQITTKIVEEYTPKMQDLGKSYLKGRCFDNIEQLTDCFNSAAYILIPTQVLFDTFETNGIDRHKYNSEFIKMQTDLNVTLYEIALNSAIEKFSQN